jgi:hypothetical protein
MTKLQVLCNTCGNEIKSGGLSVSVSAGSEDLGIDIKIGLDTALENHFCGKGCLMTMLNELTDKINGVTASQAREPVAAGGTG